MKTTKTLRSALILILTLAHFGLVNPGRAAPPASHSRQSQPPILLQEDEFEPHEWIITAAATGGATFTVTQQLTGGYASPPFRFMSHAIPPVASGLATIAVTHIYTAYTFDPATQGAITAIDYSEAGRILSFPWPDAFSTTLPVVVQNGQVYSTTRFIRFIAQNSTHAWEYKGLSNLVAADFSPVSGPAADHPDFSPAGSPIQFGFMRLNSRGSTQPPVPPGQDLVIDQGVDHWQLIIEREIVVPPNQPPQAIDDVFILNGYNRSLPVTEYLDVADNDTDPDLDHLDVITATQSAYGSTGVFGGSGVFYQLEEAQVHDTFYYTVGDGDLTDDGQVDIYIDCACAVLCLNSLEPDPPARASGLAAAADSIDLPLIYRVRDNVLKTTADGQRYVDMYYHSNPEILVTILLNPTLRAEAVATVELWQPNLSSLVDSDGSAVITQPQVDALEAFLNNLAAVSSPALQQIIAGELVRLGPLDDYVGLTMSAAKAQAIGPATVHLPLFAAP